jgi:hypothetical protein
VSDDKIDAETAAFGCLGALATVAALMVGGWLFEGFVTMKLWNWFVVPFFRAPPVTIAWALAIACVVGVLTPAPAPRVAKAGETKTDKWVTALAAIFVRPAFYLLFGYVLLRFV